jgi:hypothetical protein
MPFLVGLNSRLRSSAAALLAAGCWLLLPAAAAAAAAPLAFSPRSTTDTANAFVAEHTTATQPSSRRPVHRGAMAEDAVRLLPFPLLCLHDTACSGCVSTPLPSHCPRAQHFHTSGHSTGSPLGSSSGGLGVCWGGQGGSADPRVCCPLAPSWGAPLQPSPRRRSSPRRGIMPRLL